MSEEILKLIPAIKEYDWGNSSFIPALLGKEVTGKPQAELWMGAHKSGLCTLADSGKTFRDYLDGNPDFAGCKADDFPFLFKVLAIDKPLSIQCHPDREQAMAGFASGNDSYSDPNEKAEMFYALSDSTLLCGFRKQPVVDDETQALYEYFNKLYPDDPACKYAYKLNLLHLEAGEAVYLKPRIPHAYIQGNGIELMTNSDNVLRLGLTHKKIDSKELYKVMIQSAFEPDLLGSFEDNGGEHFFTPAGFQLTVMKDGFFFNPAGSVRLIICTEGEAVLNESFKLEKGQVCAVSKNTGLSTEVDGTLFCASC